MVSTVEHSITPGFAKSTRPGVWLTEFNLVLMALIWGVNFSVVKFGATFVAPLAYNGLRVSIAAIVLLVIVLASGGPLPARATIVRLTLIGMLGNGVYQFFFIEGIARTRASDAALCVAASPAFIAILGRLRGIERTSMRGAAGIVLSIAGIALVVLGTATGSSGQASLTGDVLVLCGSLSWAVFTILLKPYTDRVPGLQLSAFTMVGGALALLVVSAPAVLSASWRTMPVSGWMAIFYSAIFALVIAYFFWYRGVRVIGPTRTAMFSNLQPIIAVLVAWPLLGETPTPWQIVGTVSIMSGLLLTRT